MPAPRTDAPAPDFGTQGGDPSRGVDMDLSTCVNRYGPAPAAIAALRAIEPADIVLHPYEAAPQLIELYHASVQVPMPAYTDYLKAVPGRGFNPADTQIPSLEQIDAALNAAGVVI